MPSCGRREVRAAGEGAAWGGGRGLRERGLHGGEAAAEYGGRQERGQRTCVCGEGRQREVGGRLGLGFGVTVRVRVGPHRLVFDCPRLRPHVVVHLKVERACTFSIVLHEEKTVCTGACKTAARVYVHTWNRSAVRLARGSSSSSTEIFKLALNRLRNEQLQCRSLTWSMCICVWHMRRICSACARAHTGACVVWVAHPYDHQRPPERGRHRRRRRKRTQPVA